LRDCHNTGMVIGERSGSIKMYVTVVGLVAAFLTTVSFVPQVLRTWNTRSTKDISLAMFVAYTTGIGLWLIYGIFLRDIPIIASNAVTFVLAAIILGLKLRHG
jgi:MtN3 and saliva related transmembrane protein